MQIQQLTIKNFKKFQECRIEFDPHFNLFVGDHREVGKTRSLTPLPSRWIRGFWACAQPKGQAASTGITSISSLFPNQIPPPSKSSSRQLLRLRVSCKDEPIQWADELLREGGRTTAGRTKEIVSLAEQADHAVNARRRTIDSMPW